MQQCRVESSRDDNWVEFEREYESGRPTRFIKEQVHDNEDEEEIDDCVDCVKATIWSARNRNYNAIWTCKYGKGDDEKDLNSDDDWGLLDPAIKR